MSGMGKLCLGVRTACAKDPEIAWFSQKTEKFSMKMVYGVE